MESTRGTSTPKWTLAPPPNSNSHTSLSSPIFQKKVEDATGGILKTSKMEIAPASSKHVMLSELKGNVTQVKVPSVAFLWKRIIKSLFKSFVLDQGLGSDQSIKSVSSRARKQLKGLLSGEEIFFKTTNGKKLEGMYFKGLPKPGVEPRNILICTGSHQSYEKYAFPMIDEFRKMGQ